MAEMTAFTKSVLQVLRALPRGRVATYQQVAALAGNERASRGVVWILKSMSEKHELPWQRVIKTSGKIAFKPGTSQFLNQRRLLRAEGVAIGALGEIDLGKFGWRRKPRRKRRAANQPKMFSD